MAFNYFVDTGEKPSALIIKRDAKVFVLIGRHVSHVPLCAAA